MVQMDLGVERFDDVSLFNLVLKLKQDFLTCHETLFQGEPGYPGLKGRDGPKVRQQHR